jgi:hypothetical protein
MFLDMLTGNPVDGSPLNAGMKAKNFILLTSMAQYIKIILPSDFNSFICILAGLDNV